MNLKDFFSCVLPDAGLTVIAHLVPGRKGLVQRFYEDKEKAAQAAFDFDNEGYDVYFGCACYSTNESRKASNVQAVRSFWLDLDVGKGKPYATKREAAESVLQFGITVGLPRPMLVSSGRGVHVYWPMDTDIDPADWKRVAEKLKTVTAHAGLHADPARTADIASILRPPGTHNRKADPLPVEVRIQGQIGVIGEFEAALDHYIVEHELQVIDPDLPSNDDLLGDQGRNANADAERIADECAVMGYVRDTRGNVDQPTWYHALQVLGSCVNGETYAHNWSCGHPNYTREETQREFERASQHRPTTCAKFAEFHPDRCKICPHFKKINSPIALGMGKTQQTVELPADESNVDPRTITFPKGYKFKDGKIYKEVQVDDGNGEMKPVDVLILEEPVILTDRLDFGKEEGMGYRVEYLRQGRWRNFTISAALVAGGGKDLKAELGKHELWVADGVKESEMQQYLKAWMNLQKEKLAARGIYKHFGWVDLDNGQSPGFLIGDRLLKPGGIEEKVLLRDNAEIRAKGLGIKGDYNVWKHIVETAYNQPGMEPLQFLVMCGFASPLFALFGEVAGITVYAYSTKTGKGKSTACQTALSVWGDWSAMQLADRSTTANAFWGIIGTYHNIPVVYDELTNMSPEEASEVVFGMSHGRVKERMDVTGKLRDNNSTWKNILLATGNNMLSEKLSYNRANATPELARVFEFNAKVEHRLNAAEASRLFSQLLTNHGHAGIEFIRHIVDNYDSVREDLLEWRDSIIDTFTMKTDERFWSALFASIMCSLEICHKLDILRFSQSRMLHWIKDQLAMNRNTQNSHISDPRDHFAQMLNDLSPYILETDIIGDSRMGGRAAQVIRDVRGPLLGRHIRSDRQIWLRTDAVRKWCVEHKISAADMIEEIKKIGWITHTKAREALGRGVMEHGANAPRTSVYVIDVSRVEADTEGAIAPRGPVAVIGGNANVNVDRANNQSNSRRTLP